MAIDYVIVTDATQELLTLDSVKAALRVDFTDEDAVISQYITDARVYAEDLLRRTLVPKTIRATIEPGAAPSGALSGSIVGQEDYDYRWNERISIIPFAFYGPVFQLPMTPVSNISLVEYQLTRYDNPEWTTLAATDANGNPNYRLDQNTDPNQIAIMPMLAAGRFRITYTAGYAIGACPARITSAMRQLISFWYDNRDGESAIPENIIDAFIGKRVFML